MNVFAPVSNIMSKKLITVNPADSLLSVQALFEKHNIHHIPVVRHKTLVGLISKQDVLAYSGHFSKQEDDRFINTSRLGHTTASDIMTTHLATLEEDDRINVALEVFSINRFHALPVLKDGELTGILTPFDILKQLREEKLEHPEDAYKA